MALPALYPLIPNYDPLNITYTQIMLLFCSVFAFLYVLYAFNFSCPCGDWTITLCLDSKRSVRSTSADQQQQKQRGFCLYVNWRRSETAFSLGHPRVGSAQRPIHTAVVTHVKTEENKLEAEMNASGHGYTC